MRIEVKENGRCAVNLTNGTVPGLWDVYVGTNDKDSSYFCRKYRRSNSLCVHLLSEIKRK